MVARCSTQLTFADFHNMKPLKQRSFFLGEGCNKTPAGDSIMSKKKWEFLGEHDTEDQDHNSANCGKHQVVTIF